MILHAGRSRPPRPTAPPGRWDARVGGLVAFACVLLVSIRFIWLHRISAPVRATPFSAFVSSPNLPPIGFGWWSWWDQGKYLEEATAWAHGSLSPALHYYLPGYPLLATPWIWLGQADPFLVPNLVCLVGGLVLFGFLSARVLDDRRFGFALGALVFTATTALSPLVLWSWVVPWSTTPASLCLSAALLAALRFLDRPRPAAAFLVGLLGFSTACFRPADCLCLALVAGPVLLSAVEMRGPQARPFRIAAAAVAGAGLPLAGLVLAHVVVYGQEAGDYLALSSRIGFEWRLLPLRWVLLVLDPMPFLPSGRGLAAAFPWILPGMAGMVAALLAPHGAGRRVHLLVVGVALLDGATFLAYRDLHPPALWRYLNYHYFKWVLPVFGLYLILLLRMLAQPRRLPALVGMAVVALLSLWRVEPAGLVPLRRPASAGSGIHLPAGLSLSQGLMVPASDPSDLAYFGPDIIATGTRTFLNTEAFKTYVVPGGLMVLPLRSMPAEASLFKPAAGVLLDTAATPLLFRERLAFGLPCWIWQTRRSCSDRFLLTPPVLPLDQAFPFGVGGSGQRFLVNGWSGADPQGRWSEGPEAALSFTVPPGLPPVAHPVLLLKAHGFVDGGSPPVQVRFRIGGRQVASAAFTDDRVQSIPLPIGARSVVVRLVIVNPRRPSEVSSSADSRLLGLSIEQIRLVDGSEAALGR